MSTLDLFMAGVVLDIFGLFVLRYAWRDAARERRWIETRAKPIDDLVAGHAPLRPWVRVEGTVGAADDELFESPLSKSRCVYCRLRRQALAKKGWRVVATGARAVPFVVADGSTSTARVLAASMRIRATLRDHVGVAYGDAHPSAEEFLREHATDDTTEDLFTPGVEAPPPDYRGRVRWIEELVLPGDELRVLGRARMASPKSSTAYRAEPDAPVLEIHAGEGDELLAAPTNVGTNLRGLRGAVRFGVALVVLGALAWIYAASR